MATYGPFRIT